MKSYTLRWTNFSGDTFEDVYTEEEANILFECRKITSTRIELIPANGWWTRVWNRKED